MEQNFLLWIHPLDAHSFIKIKNLENKLKALRAVVPACYFNAVVSQSTIRNACLFFQWNPSVIISILYTFTKTFNFDIWKKKIILDKTFTRKCDILNYFTELIKKHRMLVINVLFRSFKPNQIMSMWLTFSFNDSLLKFSKIDGSDRSSMTVAWKKSYVH